MSSKVLILLPNKVLVAAFQSLAIRRERGSTFNGRPIIDTQDPVIHWIELILDDGSRFGRPCSYSSTAMTESETQTRHERFWKRKRKNHKDEEEGRLKTESLAAAQYSITTIPMLARCLLFFAINPGKNSPQWALEL